MAEYLAMILVGVKTVGDQSLQPMYSDHIFPFPQFLQMPLTQLYIHFCLFKKHTKIRLGGGGARF